MSNKFQRAVEGARLKNGILWGALALTGVIEFLEEVEDGTPKGKALGKAVRKTKTRIESFKKASKESSKKIGQSK